MSGFIDHGPITDEALNAYVDGALHHTEAAHVARSAAVDPKIAERIAVLHRLKAGVAGIADDVVVIDPPRRASVSPHRRHLQTALGAMAAAAMVALATFWFATATDGPVGVANHGPVGAGADTMLERLVSRHDAWIVATEQVNAAPSVGFWSEDLMAKTGLRLVHHTVSPSGEAHAARHLAFVGPNGCRLSLFEAVSPSESSAPLIITIDGGLLSASWADERRGYALVARNMDLERFATIAGAAQDASRERGSVGAQASASLQQARQPCLG